MKCLYHHAPKLIQFLLLLKLTLSRPQRKRFTHMVDALLVCDTRTSLSALCRLFVCEPDPSAVDDCYRESPWRADDVRDALRGFALLALRQRVSASDPLPPLYVSLDDALVVKDKQTRHRQIVDWHHDHHESTKKKPAYKNGFVFVGCHRRWGEEAATFDLRPSLRDSTVRRLNRARAQGERLSFQSKFCRSRS
jgi:hypothetical protein